MQFVSFASQLIAKTKEVHASATGQTKQAAALETVYSHLLELSSRLEKAAKSNQALELAEGGSEVVKHVFAINDLARSCEDDCQRLLEVVRKLKNRGDSSRPWQSFRIAVKTIWKANEIANLEKRLHNTQTTLNLHICALTT